MEENFSKPLDKPADLCYTLITVEIPNKEKRFKTMTEIREEMLTRMIRVYGFEHEVTIEFARLLESDMSDHDLETILKAHEEMPFEEEDWE